MQHRAVLFVRDDYAIRHKGIFAAFVPFGNVLIRGTRLFRGRHQNERNYRKERYYSRGGCAVHDCCLDRHKRNCQYCLGGIRIVSSSIRSTKTSVVPSIGVAAEISTSAVFVSIKAIPIIGDIVVSVVPGIAIALLGVIGIKRERARKRPALPWLEFHPPFNPPFRPPSRAFTLGLETIHCHFLLLHQLSD